MHTLPARQAPFNTIFSPRLPFAQSLHPHRSSVFRWASAGCRGVRLRTVSVGRKKCTTEAWLMAFFEELDRSGPETGPTMRKTSLPHRRKRTRTGPRKQSTEEVFRRHGLSGGD